MQQCPNCGHRNRAGVVFCENCGASLIGKPPVDTKTLDSASEEERSQFGVDPSILTSVSVQGASVFAPGSLLRLEIEGSPEPITFEPQLETIFGRRDPATGAVPDIDLTPYAGYRMGVSRRHAALRLGEAQTLDLWDLGSSNGTFLNGQRLSAHRPYRIQDGDEVRLGQMVIRIYFPPMTRTETGKAQDSQIEDEKEKAPVSDVSLPGPDRADAAAVPPEPFSQTSAPSTVPLESFMQQLPNGPDDQPQDAADLPDGSLPDTDESAPQDSAANDKKKRG